MKRKYFTSFIICFAIHFFCISQENIIIHYIDSNIKTLLEIAQIKNSETTIEVYSIQLKASETPQKVTVIKNQYLSLFPDETIDEIFEAPYFKIITGNYSDKKQAEKKLRAIKSKFKSAFILKREISIEKFKK